MAQRIQVSVSDTLYSFIEESALRDGRSVSDLAAHCLEIGAGSYATNQNAMMVNKKLILGLQGNDKGEAEDPKNIRD